MTGITYYDRPLLKPPVWIWSIPVYFFVGGAAGAAMTLGLAVEAAGGERLRHFNVTCRWTGAIGGGAGTALLIWDLGRKGRFLAMLRVLRLTSPMSIGSWVLALATPLSAGSALLTRARGPFEPLGELAGMGAGVLGMPLATYTAVLLGNTAVPIWSATRNSLPFLFGASSAASLASVFELMPLQKNEHALIRRLAIGARAADIVATHVVEYEARRDPEVGRPFMEGVTGALWTSAKILTAASLVVSLIPGENKTRRRIAGILGIAGGLALRFAVFQAGRASSLNPKAAFSQQHSAPRLPEP